MNDYPERPSERTQDEGRLNTSPHETARMESASALLRDSDPARRVALEAVDVDDVRRLPELVAAGVVDEISAAAPTFSGAGGRRRGIAVFGAVALIGGAGLAAAAAAGFFEGPRPETTGVHCLSGNTGTILGPIRSGTPVEACVQAWRSAGEEVPKDLVMASVPDQAVMVVPRAEVPTGATVLDGAPAIDVRLAELSDALGDSLRGTSFGGRTLTPCRSADEVEQRVDEIRDRLGVAKTPMSRHDQGGPCAWATVTADGQQVGVFLRPRWDEPGKPYFEGGAPSPEWEGYLNDLWALSESPGATADELRRGAEDAARRHFANPAPDVDGVVARQEFEITVTPTTVGDTPRLYVSNGAVHIYDPR